MRSGPRVVHPRVDQRGALHLHAPAVNLPSRAGGGGMNGTYSARGFSCAALPWLGVEGQRRRVLRLLGLHRHRTGGSEGAHVRVELCVVFGGGCACVTWTQECACVCEGGALQAGVVCEGGSRGHRRASLRGGGCVCVLRVQGGVEKGMSQVTGRGLSGCIGGLYICQVGPGVQEAHTACVLEDRSVSRRQEWLSQDRGNGGDSTGRPDLHGGCSWGLSPQPLPWRAHQLLVLLCQVLHL